MSCETVISDFSWLLNQLKSYVPLSDKLDCIADEAYVVCVGDWIYFRSRRERALRRVEDPYELMYLLRLYARDIYQMVANPSAKQIIANTASRILDPVAIYSAPISSSMYIGGVLIEFDRAVVFSDVPCIIYLLKGPSIVGYIDTSQCAGISNEFCRTVEFLFGSFLKTALEKFSSFKAQSRSQ